MGLTISQSIMYYFISVHIYSSPGIDNVLQPIPLQLPTNIKGCFRCGGVDIFGDGVSHVSLNTKGDQDTSQTYILKCILISELNI
jgi:hypothetical protein